MAMQAEAINSIDKIYFATNTQFSEENEEG